MPRGQTPMAPFGAVGTAPDGTFWCRGDRPRQHLLVPRGQTPMAPFGAVGTDLDGTFWSSGDRLGIGCTVSVAFRVQRFRAEYSGENIGQRRELHGEAWQMERLSKQRQGPMACMEPVAESVQMPRCEATRVGHRFRRNIPPGTALLTAASLVKISPVHTVVG